LENNGKSFTMKKKSHLGEKRSRSIEHGHAPRLDHNAGRINAVIERARQLAKLGRKVEALHRLTSELSKFRDNPRLLSEIGDQHSSLGAHDAAERFYQLALRRGTLTVSTLVSLAGVVLQLGRSNEAVILARKAAVLVPDNPAALESVANMEAFRSKTASIGYYRWLIVMAPGSAATYLNLAEAISVSASDDDAEPYYRKAMELDPETPLIRFNFSIHLLSRGYYEEGWAHYEARLSPSMPDVPERIIDIPPWRGEPLAGKTLLICSEQGLGDEVRFAAYLPRLAKLAECLIMETDPRMVPIYERSLPRIHFHAFQRLRFRGRMRFTYPWLRKYPSPDFFSPVMSLPYLLKDDHFEAVAPNGYLVPAKTRETEMRSLVSRLRTSDGPLVGIVWASGLVNIDRASSYPALANWKQILDHPNATFFALQYGDVGDDLDQLRGMTSRPIHWLNELDLRMDLEALIAIASMCDCVVACSTASSVLAAAVGTPVIELAAVDNFFPDIGGQDALIGTIFRPRAPIEGDWHYVFSQARKHLDTLLA
jgi:Flp pilus assembly protein TadD